MTPQRWKEVEATFEQVLVLPTEERSAFFQNHCGDDDELRREVELLLQSHGKSGDFLERQSLFFTGEVFKEESSLLIPGELIGRYRIVREIGRGGMGAVYLGERADEQYKKRVAIKLIKRGMDTDAVLRQFRNERQILASFDHPNIARLFDADSTESGLPFFIMEYVEGIAIDRYCAERALNVPDRLRLFREVCAAVSYAHRHTVIHRDIKPSNILVTREGTPKLLDFGIAKYTQQGDDGAQSLATMTGLRSMTPHYASPEQIGGGPVTTASDVYSLGVVLYELLTGQCPYHFANSSLHQIERSVSETAPKKPSTVCDAGLLLASTRNSKNFAASLRGDVDNILLMALRKEPERRYSTVEQFSEDIRRHLEARPILARKDTLGYRASKFIQRNRAASVAAAMVLLSLLGGIVATTSAAHRAKAQEMAAKAATARAERRFNDVRKLAHSVLFDYHDAIKDLPGATRVRERLVKDGLAYLDSLASEAHDDPALQRELAAAYERVGDVRGGGSSGSLGDIAGAIESQMKAFRIRKALFAVKPQDAQTRRDLASSHQKIGYLLMETSEASDGLEHLRAARTLYLDLTREQPANEDLQFELAATCNKLGAAIFQRRDLIGALAQYRAALAICEKIAVSDSRNQRYRRGRWIAEEGIADVLWLQGDGAGAIEANAKALALGEALIADDPINADYRRGLVINYQNGGDYRNRSDIAGAVEYFRRAAALDEELLAPDPANALTRADLGYTHKRIADFLANLQKSSEALSHFRKALEISEKLVADAPSDLSARFGVVTCRAGVAGMEAQLGEIDPALAECRKATDLLAKITEDASDAGQRFKRAQAYEYLGYAYVALAESSKAPASDARKRMTDGRDMFGEALKVLDDLRSRGTLDPNNELYAKEIAGEMAKCENNIGKMGALVRSRNPEKIP